MTEANRKSQRRPLTTAACLAMAMAIAITAMPGTAYAGGDSGGKGDGRDRKHEKKHSDQGQGVYDAKDFLDRWEGKHPPGGSGGGSGSGGDGSGSGGGKLGSCSRC